jgi:hypothetical protein
MQQYLSSVSCFEVWFVIQVHERRFTYSAMESVTKTAALKQHLRFGLQYRCTRKRFTHDAVDIGASFSQPGQMTLKALLRPFRQYPPTANPIGRLSQSAPDL